MNYSIKIDEFEGPFDLLLHLIKSADMDIYNISIDRITKDYFDYINKMEQLNINVASEYLVMAAELMEIKSSSLLPSNKSILEESEDEELSEANLINKLLEYKKYKEMMPVFKNMEEERKKIFIKSPEAIKNYVDEEKITQSDVANIDDLFKAFMDFLDRKKRDKPLDAKITNKEYSVKERKKYIIDKLYLKKKLFLDDLFEDVNKEIVIVTFMSVLELAKENMVNIIQEDNFKKITIKLRDDEDDRNN